MSKLFLVVVPSRSIWAVRLAAPPLPPGSAVPPLPITSVKSASGSSCCSTIISFNPLGSSRVMIGGRDTRGGGPSSGGFVRSTVPCARMGKAIRGNAATAVIERFIDHLQQQLLKSASFLFSPLEQR